MTLTLFEQDRCYFCGTWDVECERQCVMCKNCEGTGYTGQEKECQVCKGWGYVYNER